jgi:hypothetical protein
LEEFFEKKIETNILALNSLLGETNENVDNVIMDLQQKFSEEIAPLKEEQEKLVQNSNLLFEKQTSNENLTKELNASLLDLLKEEIEQVKETLLGHSNEMHKISQNVSEEQEVLQNLQILETKFKKFPSKKKIDAKFDLIVESLKKEIQEVNSVMQENLMEIKTQLGNKIKVKMDKKDLSHFLIKKLDTETFNSQISIVSDSVLGMKKKIGILQNELRNFPKQQISEVKLISKIEKKMKKNYLNEIETDIENKFKEVQSTINEMNNNQINHKKTLENQLNIKADREVIQQLLREQAKINEFICAENVVARFKVKYF